MLKLTIIFLATVMIIVIHTSKCKPVVIEDLQGNKYKRGVQDCE